MIGIRIISRCTNVIAGVNYGSKEPNRKIKTKSYSAALSAMVFILQKISCHPQYNFKQRWGGLNFGFNRESDSFLVVTSFGQQKDLLRRFSTKLASTLAHFLCFHFKELRPGKWKLSVIEEDLPEQTQLEQGVFEVVAEPGEEETVLFKIIP